MSSTMTSMSSSSGPSRPRDVSRLFSRTCRTSSDTPRTRWGAPASQGSSVAAVGRRVAEGPRALVAEEVVRREDVVHLQALGAGVAFADVALQERVVVDDPAALAVIEQGSGGAP